MKIRPKYSALKFPCSYIEKHKEKTSIPKCSHGKYSTT